MPFPIEHAIYFAAASREDEEFHIYSHDLEKSSVFNGSGSLELSSWTRYFESAILALKSEGYPITGMNFTLMSDLPFGAGMSSSSALTCGFIFTLNELNGWGISKKDIVFLASKAENGTGVNGGQMDQFSICMGQKGKAILLDCKDFQYDLIDINIDDAEWLLINSNVEHQLAQSEYNVRRRECEDGFEKIKSKYPELHSVRGVDLDILADTKEDLFPKEYNRIKHVIEENDRVRKMANAISQQNLKEIGQLLFQSHESLSHLYEVSCKELDYIVSHLKTYDKCFGARMMGGGFGGSVIALIEKDYNLDDLKKGYLETFGIPISVLPVRSGSGVKVLD